MTEFNVIKINPSQELKLEQARDAFFGKGEPVFFDKESGLVRQKIDAKRPIFLWPLLCVLPDDFTKEDFLEISRLNFFRPASCKMDSKAQDQGDLYYFPALIKAKGRQFFAALPCAFTLPPKKAFDLQKFLSAQSQSWNFFPKKKNGTKKKPSSPQVHFIFRSRKSAKTNGAYMTRSGKNCGKNNQQKDLFAAQ